MTEPVSMAAPQAAPGFAQRHYAPPAATLVRPTTAEQKLLAMKRKLATLVWQGAAVFLLCSMAVVGILSGIFEPPGMQAAATVDGVVIAVVVGLGLGALSGLLGMLTALYGGKLCLRQLTRLRQGTI
ncbi:MAG: hypothetical protein KDA24_27170 [Deltaproteobacteria bacterium]|nr:hypothetical protein [Deltaproteobacteria bacterium]